MNVNRSTILDQLASGQISAEEAERLLRDKPSPPAPAAPPGAGNLASRWLHVRVSDLATGRQKVNVNVPLSWVQVGLQIGAQHQPDLGGLDLEEIVDLIRSGANGKIVEVEDLEDGERVEVYVD